MRTKRETAQQLTLRILGWEATKDKTGIVISSKGLFMAWSAGGSVREAVRESFLDLLKAHGLSGKATQSVLSATSASEAEVKKIRRWLWL